MSSSKLPKVSVIGGTGKDRTGFEKLPDSDPTAAVIAAARKSRQHKNLIALKIGAVILTVSAVAAVLVALIFSRGSTETETGSPTLGSRRARTMKIDITDHEAVDSVAAATEMFSRDLYRVMTSVSAEDDNLLLSPYSAAMVLAMATAGAHGITEQQMKTGLHISELRNVKSGWSQTIPSLRTNENFTLETANSAFVMENYNILEEYKDTLHENFHADISPVNFADSQLTASRINDWVKDMTNNKIDSLIDEDMINGLTRLVLVNAIYFKGDWETKFDPKKTQQSAFYVSNVKNVETDMMMMTEEFPRAVIEQLDITMLEMPYKGDRIVMQIVLPNERSQGLTTVEEKLDKVDINDLFQKNQRTVKTKVKLPKFKVSQSSCLTDHLKKLGMEEMFSQGGADFSGIDGTRNLFVGFVQQEVFIEVNEEGSEAAAATGMGMMMRSMPLPPEEFTVDHPFIFYIRDKLTGMLLFQGRITDPSAS